MSVYLQQNHIHLNFYVYIYIITFLLYISHCVQEGGDDYCEVTDAGALGTGSTGYVWQPSAGTIIIAID